MKKVTKLISMRIYCNQTIFGCLASAVLASALLLISVNDTKITNQIECQKFPTIYYSNDSKTYQNLFERAIKNATRRISIAATSTKLDFGTLGPLLNASHVPPSKIQIFTSNESSVQTLSKKLGFKYTIYNPEIFQAKFLMIVSDDSAYVMSYQPVTAITPFYRILSFEQCTSGSDDILAFINYCINLQQSHNTHIAKIDMQAKTSPIQPINMDNSLFFSFYNPKSRLFPLRIHTQHILEEELSDEPNTLYIYSKTPPYIMMYEAFSSSDFHLYYDIKALLMRNKTKIYYLASVHSGTQTNWYNQLTRHDNFQLRTLDESYFSFDFMVSDNWTYIFSHEIRSLEINEDVSLHFATNNSKILSSSLDFFNKRWEEGKPYSDE